ncbi:MAG TPA: phosphatidylglycerophosphatase A [Terriglobia bacterium]|nr:phosphatidylglycerophosphatase A [Terriglobia bacterium]
MKTDAVCRPSGLWDSTAIVIATGLGAGFAPKAPGTAGAVVGVAVYLAMEWLRVGAYFPHAIVFFLVAGTWAAHRVEVFWGHDAQRIVVDEVAGQMIAFAAAAGHRPLSIPGIAAGFVLFRIFDIWKPFPLRRLEMLPGGLGVMADDVGAGLYALIILSAVLSFLK